MSQRSFFRSAYTAAFFLSTFLFACAAQAVMDSQYEIDTAALVDSPVKAKRPPAKKHRTAPAHAEQTRSSRTGILYTVKSGDHLFKILMRDFGLSNEEVDVVIDEIRRENNIYDIRRLKIGQTILIPPIRRSADGSLKLPASASASATARHESASAPRQTFSLAVPRTPLTDQDALARLHGVWDKLVPRANDLQKPLSLQTDSFSLSLDPSRYPVFAAMNNGRILLDQAGTIPPLVKALIEEKDPSTRIVSVQPLATHRSLATLLAAAGFYSVEENFSLDFGSDPTLTIHADFKIEKKPDSLIAQDIVLMNGALEPAPAVLDTFLKKEGFSLYEPFASASERSGHSSSPRTLSLITVPRRESILDAILTSLSVTADRDRRLDVFAADTNGISLSVKA